jgi:hypothetical protein
MLCVNPYRVGTRIEYGCGRCLPCRINRMSMWEGRIILELLGTWKAGAQSSFVTLTYDDKSVPKTPDGVPTLRSEDWRAFTHRIGARYFGCGEYGDRTWRPHYHLLLFGMHPERITDLVARRWPHGFFDIKPAAVEHARYSVGYVAKKLTKPDLPALDGRHPEFARMSRRPAVGTFGLEFLKTWLQSEAGREYVAKHGDVPLCIRKPPSEGRKGSTVPLGRTMVRKLREFAGLPASSAERSERYLDEHAFLLALPGQAAARENRRSRQYDQAKHKARFTVKGTL